MILGETILVTTAVVSGSVVFLFCLATSIEEVRRQRREKEEDDGRNDAHVIPPLVWIGGGVYR